MSYEDNLMRIVQGAFENKGTEVFEALDDIMSEKLANAIVNRQEEMMDEFYGDIGEEVENLYEISKKTLGSYVKKAGADLYSRGSRTQYHTNRRDKASGPFEKESKRKHQKLADYNYSKAGKRADGIERAMDRLTKEEVENLDEISRKTLGSYVKKASDDKAIGMAGIVDTRLDKKERDPYIKKYQKRSKGITKAVDRLAKEEVENLDEADGTRQLNRGRNKGKWSHIYTKKAYDSKEDAKKAYDKHIEKDRNTKIPLKMLKPMESVEVENLDELSTKTVRNYQDKAEKDYNTASDKERKYGNEAEKSRLYKSQKKAQAKKWSDRADRRDKGLKMAYNRVGSPK